MAEQGMTARPEIEPLDDSSVAAWRREFPVLARRTYLNSGSYGALALSVKAAMEDYLRLRLEEGADWGHWVGRNEAVRAGLAQLFGVRPAEIAVTTSASAGINAFASCLDFSGKRNRVVVSDFEFPTNGQIWHAQERRGAEVVHAPVADDGHIPVEHFERLIDERTRVVAVTHVCYRNGRRLDVEAIARIARERGALFMLDCYQSAGSQVLPLGELDVDVAVGGTLKYMLGTAGVGFMYVRESMIEQLVPTCTGWMAQRDPGAMDITGYDPAPDARRFESGTPPVVGCYATEAGLAILERAGMPAIEQRIVTLSGRCLDRLSDAGIATATPREDALRGPTVAIRSTNDVALVEQLAADGIVTSCRDGNVRASFHFYNDDSDIDALLAALERRRPLVVSS